MKRSLQSKFSKVTSIHTIAIPLAALILLTTSCMVGAFQYKMVNAQEEQSAGLERYDNGQLGISFEYPTYLVPINIPSGIALIPVSEENSQQHSITIFVSKLPPKFLQLSPGEIVEQIFHPQDIRVSVRDSVYWVSYTLANGEGGLVGIGNYGAGGKQEWYMFGYGIDPNAVQYSDAPRTVINSMLLGHISSSTMQLAKRVQNEIQQDKLGAMRTVINNMRS